MIKEETIRQIAEEHFRGSKLFLVDVIVRPGNNFELLIDSDDSVSIGDCEELNRLLEDTLDRDVEDFALTVSSAGIGQPLKLFRQYKKLVGKSVEVVLKNGVKVRAQLKDATEDTITLTYEERVKLEGQKRPQMVERIQEYKLEDVKSTIEFLDYT